MAANPPTPGFPESALSTTASPSPAHRALAPFSQHRSLRADGPAHAGDRTTPKDSRVWGPQLTVHISLTAKVRTDSNSSGYLSLPLPTALPVPLVQEPQENGQNVLVPEYPSTQYSSWHIVRTVFLSMYYGCDPSTSPSGSLLPPVGVF